MKKIYLLQKCFAVSVGILLCNYIHAQNTFPSTGSAGIGTTTPNASSIFDMVSTSKGMLVPRMTKFQRDAIGTPATGLMIYQTNNTPGFYYYTGTAWTALTPKAKGWSLTGNAGTNPATNFIGTTDAQSLVLKVNNEKAGLVGYSSLNTSFGYQTLNSNTASANTAFGYQALLNNSLGASNTAIGTYALLYNTTGNYNTANGNGALFYNTDGGGNTATGFEALYFNTGNYNTANGHVALSQNTTGYYNTATGGYSMQNNKAGIGNTANGISALRNNTNGSDNTAMGANTLFYNTTGYSNIAVGTNALFKNTAGNNLVAVGDSALYNQNGAVTAGANTAIGSKALLHNVNGCCNTGLGYQALLTNDDGSNNTASGYGALYNTIANSNTGYGSRTLFNNIYGNYNTAIGSNSDVNNYNYSNSSAFGYQTLITASNQVRVGNPTVNSIGGYAGWTTLPSDKRVKKNIKENVPGLDFINKLKAVTYNLDLNAIEQIVQRPAIKDKEGKIMQPSADELLSRKEKEKIIYTGFVAQDVEAAAASLHYDFSGVDIPKNDKDMYGLRYAEFVVPLVKAVQELSAQNDELKKDFAAKLNDLQKQIEELKNQTANQNPSPKSLKTISISNATLAQNIPNPFTNTTIINYSVPANIGSAQIIISDKSGKILKKINVSGVNGSVQVNAATLSAGAYQYSLLVDGKIIDTKQMEHLK